MMETLIVLFLSIAQNWLATTEIHSIAREDAGKAAAWAGIRSVMSFLLLVVIVIDYERWRLIIPYAAGDACGTYLALYKKRRS